MELTRSHVMPDGATIHYRLWQAGRQPRGLIVLLHGMASNLTRWSEFIEHTSLKESWDILRPDLRGHARSLVRSRIGADVWSADLIELLDAHDCERVLIVGHSLGAHLALQFAGRFPERVLGLALIDPAFPSALRGRLRWFRTLRPLLSAVAAIVRFSNALGLRREHLPQRDLREWDERVRQDLLTAGRSDEFVKRYSSVGVDLKYFPLAHYLQELVEMTRPLPRLAELPIPTLVALSRGVTFTDPLLTQQLLADLPHVETTTIDAYHWPLTEKPAEVRTIIENWIARKFPEER